MILLVWPFMVRLLGRLGQESTFAISCLWPRCRVRQGEMVTGLARLTTDS